MSKSSPTIFILFVLLTVFVFPVPGYSVEPAPRISDREIIESLARLEEVVKTNREMIESMRADIRSQITSLRTEILGFMKWGFGLILSGMFILIGFILWDRRSTIKPVKDEISELEKEKVDRLVAAMKVFGSTGMNVVKSHNFSRYFPD